MADRIASELEVHGHDTTTVNVKEVSHDLDLEDFDAVLVGASIHFGRQQTSVRRWARANRGVLVTKPTGFFQISGASGDEGNEESAAEAVRYVDEFVEATGWRPDRIGRFGGAIRFSEYGFLLGALVKRIVGSAFPEGVEDASGDVEFTDWESVEAFADEFATFVEE